MVSQSKKEYSILISSVTLVNLPLVSGMLPHGAKIKNMLNFRILKLLRRTDPQPRIIYDQKS